jgi:hypothetical protein
VFGTPQKPECSRDGGEIEMKNKDDFIAMINDWQADKAPEYDDLVIGEPEIGEDGEWIAIAEDEKCVYILSDDGDGNIVINYDGTK